MTEHASQEPPDLLKRLRSGWYLPVGFAIVLAAVGAFLASREQQVFTASASLSVGTTNVNTASSLGGFAASAPTLAGAYSRAIQAEDVVEPVARELGATPSEVRASLVASQVPNTPVIRIDASARTEQLAVRLANLASDALEAYAGDLNTVTRLSDQLLTRYRKAQAQTSRLQATRDRLARRPPGQNGDELARADGVLAANKLQVQSLAEAYRASQVSLGATPPLSRLEQASSAASDRSSRLQTGGLTGGAVGLVIGSALALLLARRRLRRDQRSERS